MESESFSEWIREQNNLWIYASNITQFHFFDLEFADTSNVVLVQIIHPEQPQLPIWLRSAGDPSEGSLRNSAEAERVFLRLRLERALVPPPGDKSAF